MFKLRQDNREKGVDDNHVKVLMRSISGNNLLEFKPILINVENEVVDGQHRLEAAKRLGLEIWYEKNEELQPIDIITLNMAKAWRIADFLNFWVKNGAEEYIKLKSFVERHKIETRVCLGLCVRATSEAVEDFKTGKFVFKDDLYETDIFLIKESIKFMKTQLGNRGFFESAKFWRALIKLMKHPEFNFELWDSNLQRLIHKILPKVSINDYFDMFCEIYNYKQKNKLSWENIPTE